MSDDHYSDEQIFETMRLLHTFYLEGVMHEKSMLEILDALIAATTDRYREYWVKVKQNVTEHGALFGAPHIPEEEELFVRGTVYALREQEDAGTLFDNLMHSWQEMNRTFPGLWERGSAGNF